MSIFAYLIYFVWLALLIESVRYDVFYPAPAIANPPRLGWIKELP